MLAFNTTAGDLEQAESESKLTWDGDSDATLVLTYTVDFSKLYPQYNDHTAVEGKSLVDLLGDSDGYTYNCAKVSLGNEAHVQNKVPKPSTSLTKTGEYDAATNTITYTVTLNNGLFGMIPEGATVTDSFDPRLTYVEGSLSASLSLALTQNEYDPTLTYKDLATYSYNGTVNEGNTIQVTFEEANWTLTGKSGAKQWITSLNTSVDVYDVASEMSGGAPWYQWNGINIYNTPTYSKALTHAVVTLTYQLEVQDEFLQDALKNDTSLKLTNEVSVDKGFGQDTTATVEVKPVAVSKEYLGRVGTANRASYKVDINESAATLPVDGTLTLTDTMCKYLFLDDSTLKVYSVSADGTETEITGWNYTYTTPSDADHILKITGLPNSTHLRVKYQASVSNATGTVKLVNKASITGNSGEKSTSDNFAVSESGGDASGANFHITIYKRDNDSKADLLDGASFKLYYFDADGDKTWKENLSDATYVTSTAGTSHVVRPTAADSTSLYFDTLYKLVEVTPPSGYKTANTAYFWVRGNKANK